MWARFTVLRDTPIDSAIAGCVIPFSRSNTIWMRWRCWGCPFQRSAVFKRRISFLVHLTTCSSESNQIRWSVRIILRLTNAIHIRIRCFATINIRFNQLWKRYKDEHGEWHIEPCELHRVYPPVASTEARSDATPQHAPGED